MTGDPNQLAEDLKTFAELAEQSSKQAGPVTAKTSLPLADTEKSKKLLDQYRQLGIERIVCALRYNTIEE